MLNTISVLQESYTVTSLKVADLKYGENPQQKQAALYKDVGDEDPLGLSNFVEVDSQAPGYVNLTDLDSGIALAERAIATFEHNLLHLELPEEGDFLFAAALKHCHPCGASIIRTGGSSAIRNRRTHVVKQMLQGDLLAVLGATIILNFEVDEEIANELLHFSMKPGKRRIIDCIIAPSITPEAIAALRRKGAKGRLIINPALSTVGLKTIRLDKLIERPVRSGRIIQEPPRLFSLDHPAIEVAHERYPGHFRSNYPDVLLGVAIAERCASNTIIRTRGFRLIGGGIGQQDRFAAAHVANWRTERSAGLSGENTQESVAVSDSFFTMPDAVEELISKASI